MDGDGTSNPLAIVISNECRLIVKPSYPTRRIFQSNVEVWNTFGNRRLARLQLSAN